MLFTEDAQSWLDDVDPWTEREATDLLRAVRGTGSAGIFDCAANADATQWFVIAPHAERVLLLSSMQAWQDFIAKVASQYGLNDLETSELCPSWHAASVGGATAPRAANDSRLMPLLDLAVNG